jgi:glyoxylase I family protein
MQTGFQGATPLFMVFDVPTAVAFYRDVLGFDLVSTSVPFDEQPDNFGWAMLRRDAVTLMVNNMYEDNFRPSAPDASRCLAHHDTVLYISCRELDALVTTLRARGVRVSGPAPTYYGMLQATVHDPDGYSLCFQRPADPADMD